MVGLDDVIRAAIFGIVVAVVTGLTVTKDLQERVNSAVESRRSEDRDGRRRPGELG